MGGDHAPRTTADIFTKRTRYARIHIKSTTPTSRSWYLLPCARRGHTHALCLQGSSRRKPIAPCRMQPTGHTSITGAHDTCHPTVSQLLPDTWYKSSSRVQKSRSSQCSKRSRHLLRANRGRCPLDRGIPTQEGIALKSPPRNKPRQRCCCCCCPWRVLFEKQRRTKKSLPLALRWLHVHSTADEGLNHSRIKIVHKYVTQLYLMKSCFFYRRLKRRHKATVPPMDSTMHP